MKNIIFWTGTVFVCLLLSWNSKLSAQTAYTPGVPYVFTCADATNSSQTITFTVIYQSNGTADVYRTVAPGTGATPAVFSVGLQQNVNPDGTGFVSGVPAGHNAYRLLFIAGPLNTEALPEAIYRINCPCRTNSTSTETGSCKAANHQDPNSSTSTVSCVVDKFCSDCSAPIFTQVGIAYNPSGNGVLLFSATSVILHY